MYYQNYLNIKKNTVKVFHIYKIILNKLKKSEKFFEKKSTKLAIFLNVLPKLPQYLKKYCKSISYIYIR